MNTCPHCGESLVPPKPTGRKIVKAGRHIIVGNRRELKEAILDAGPWVVLDLAATVYIDSSGLGMMCSAAKDLRKEGGGLLVANPSEDLRALFDLTHVWELLPEADAVAA